MFRLLPPSRLSSRSPPPAPILVCKGLKNPLMWTNMFPSNVSATFILQTDNINKTATEITSALTSALNTTFSEVFIHPHNMDRKPFLSLEYELLKHYKNEAYLACLLVYNVVHNNIPPDAAFLQNYINLVSTYSQNGISYTFTEHMLWFCTQLKIKLPTK